MTPSLDRSAKLVLFTSALFTAVGYIANSWPLAVIGEAPIFALLGALLAFYPSLLMLRRRRVELLWWIPGGEGARNTRIVDQPFTVRIVIRNKGFSDVYAGRLRILGGSALALAEAEEAGGFIIPRQAEVAFDLPLVAKSAGHWQLHGASLEVRAPFGLFSTQVYFPNPLELTVLPPLLAPRGGMAYRPAFGALQARSGAHFVRRAGIGTELREIREHAPGDSFKQIEWKASARFSKLMSREFENEISIEARVLVDASPTMREGPLGRAPLDQAIALAGALARVLLDGRDRIGLLTYDTRILAQLKPGEGAAHLTQYLGALLELKRVVDEDLCAIDNSELVSLVARYLAYQEGVSAKARNHGQPGSIVLGADGIRYDLFRMTRSIEQLLAEAREEGGARPLDGPPRARDPRFSIVRQLCRVRGIELPYRRPLPSDPDRGQVLAQVLTQAVASGKGSTLLLVLSDLRNITDIASLTRAVALAKRRHHRLVFVCPARGAEGALEQELAQFEQARARRPVVQALQALGVPVISAAPDESLPALLRRVLSAKRGN
jgi:uncharacterized protein (DUF58 family)